MKPGWDINAIVDEVVRRITARQVPTAAPATSPDSSRRRLRLPQKLITLSDIQAKLDGVDVLELRADAVVTPAVRDEVRDRGVSLRIGDATCRRDQPAAASNVSLAVGTTNGVVVAPSLFTDLPVSVTGPTTGSLVDILADIGPRIQRSALGLILTRQPAAAVCLANRCEWIRAAAATEPQDVCEAVEQIGANLLVVRWPGRGSQPIRNLVRTFVRNPHRACPADWLPSNTPKSPTR